MFYLWELSGLLGVKGAWHWPDCIALLLIE